MHVNVHRAGVDLQKQGSQRVAAHHQQGVVGLGQGRIQREILHPAAVDEEGHLTAVRTGDRSRADETRQLETVLLRQDFQHLPGCLDAVERGQDRAPVAVAGGLQGGLVPFRKLEAYVRIGQRVAGHEGIDRAPLGDVRFQEFQARRDVVKQVLDLHYGPGRDAGLHDFPFLPALHAHARADRLVRCARGDGQSRNGTDRSQGLAAEPKRGDGKKLAGGSKLGGGVTRDRQRQLVGGDAGAVVGHLDQAPARPPRSKLRWNARLRPGRFRPVP